MDVDNMLAADDRAVSFIEAPMAEVAPELFGEPTRVSRIGSQFGDYWILSRLGGGGWGGVPGGGPQARAEGRGQATRRELVSNAASHERFLREARLASAMDHPNIC
jgi:serine/threonine-protein kinase